MTDQEETLDVEAAVAALNKTLRLHYRSALQYTVSSGSLFGFEFQSLGEPGKAVEWPISSEEETIEALQAAIEPTGREGRSEALEHALEHLIMRKQNQVDFLVRARRSS